MTDKTSKVKLKRNKLRHNEYYDMQDTFDGLYERSSKGHKFKNIVDIVMSDENIKLAYRNIKSNTGSNTAGVDNRDINDLSHENVDKFVNNIKQRMYNYKPQPVRRVEIEKDNGKIRPLGIPTIEDRVIQQSILQVIEPICEAKFYKYSYGFRPNRGTHQAIARVYSLINMGKGFHYSVDIDIKGFFDNVNHAKLIKQMWNMGIQDKNIICIIGKMLKA